MFKKNLYFRKFLYKLKKIHFGEIQEQNCHPIHFSKMQVFLIAYVFQNCSYFTFLLRQKAKSQKNHLRKAKLFFEKKFSHNFRILMEKNSSLWQNVSGRGVKTVFYLSKAKIGEFFQDFMIFLSLSKLKWKIFSLLVNFFDTIVKTGFYVSIELQSFQSCQTWQSWPSWESQQTW